MSVIVTWFLAHVKGNPLHTVVFWSPVMKHIDTLKFNRSPVLYIQFHNSSFFYTDIFPDLVPNSLLLYSMCCALSFSVVEPHLSLTSESFTWRYCWHLDPALHCHLSHLLLNNLLRMPHLCCFSFAFCCLDLFWDIHLVMWPGLGLNLDFSCLSLPSAPDSRPVCTTMPSWCHHVSMCCPTV